MKHPVKDWVIIIARIALALIIVAAVPVVLLLDSPSYLFPIIVFGIVFYLLGSQQFSKK